MQNASLSRVIMDNGHALTPNEAMRIEGSEPFQRLPEDPRERAKSSTWVDFHHYRGASMLVTATNPHDTFRPAIKYKLSAEIQASDLHALEEAKKLLIKSGYR